MTHIDDDRDVINAGMAEAIGVGVDVRDRANRVPTGGGDMTEPTRPTAPRPEPLDEAIETIENVLAGMDWLGTGGSMEVADEEEREAWQAWDIILVALGRPGDSHARVYGEPSDD